MISKEFLFWLAAAAVWIGVFGSGIRAWNTSFRHLRAPQLANTWSVAFSHRAFTPEGQSLRLRALLPWTLGLAIVACYYLLVAPRLA